MLEDHGHSAAANIAQLGWADGAQLVIAQVDRSGGGAPQAVQHPDQG